MRNLPSISVIIPTRNRVNHLRRTIDSVLRSNYPNLELVVVDGGSSDGTQELLKSYGAKVSQWISEPDSGEYFALNKALGIATGEIIKPMPDDDVLRPEAFALAASRLTENPSIDVLFGRAAIWRESVGGRAFVTETRPVNPAKLTISNMLRCKLTFHSPACFVRRSVYDRLGPYSTGYTCGDNEFWLRCMKHHVVFDALPDVIYDSYLHNSNGIMTKKWQLHGDAMKLCREYGHMSDVAYAIWPLYILPAMYDLSKRLGVVAAVRRMRRRPSLVTIDPA